MARINFIELPAKDIEGIEGGEVFLFAGVWLDAD